MHSIISKDLKILVYRTTIDTSQKAREVRNQLEQLEDIYRVDIDLTDIDKVLRLECHPNFPSEKFEKQVDELGVKCSKLN